MHLQVIDIKFLGFFMYSLRNLTYPSKKRVSSLFIEWALTLDVELAHFMLGNVSISMNLLPIFSINVQILSCLTAQSH